MTNYLEILEIKENIIAKAKHRYEQANNGRIIVCAHSSIGMDLYDNSLSIVNGI